MSTIGQCACCGGNGVELRAGLCKLCNPPTCGGPRKGAGRKATEAVGPVARYLITLDNESYLAAYSLGDGVVSLGIRRALKAARAAD